MSCSTNISAKIRTVRRGGHPARAARAAVPGLLLLCCPAFAQNAALASTGDGGSHIGTIFYLGALAAMMLYNLVLYAVGREKGYLEYALFTVGIAVGDIALSGLGDHALWAPEGLWSAAALPAGFALAGMSAALFTRHLLDTSILTPRLDMILKIIAAAFLAAVAISFGMPKAGALFVAFAAPLFAVLAMLCAQRTRKLDTPGAALHLGGWCALLIGMVAVLATRTGVIGSDFITSSVMEVSSALGILLLSFALADRTSAQWRERALRQREELANGEQQIEALKAAEQALTNNLNQRGREIDELMRRLNESEHRFQQMSHRDALTGLANQLLLTDRIEQGIIRSKRHNTRTAVIMLDVEGFTPLVETHGQEAADALLKMIATRLRGIVREQDTVARPDSDEFVIVLEEVFDSEDLQRVVNALTDEFAQPFRIGDKVLDVSVALGSAIYPDGGGDASGLLKQAAKLMRRSKQGKQLAAREVGGDRGQVVA